MTVNYIGIDIDQPDPLRAIISYYNARYMFPNNKVEFFRSRGGYHIKIWTQVNVHTDLEVRRILGDDSERLWYAERNIRLGFPDEFIDVLFDRKYQKKYDRKRHLYISYTSYSKEIKIER